MKTIIITILTVIYSLIPQYTCSYTYTEYATVTAIDGEVVTVEMDGNTFDFYGNGYTEGDRLILTVDDNGTPNDITDDAIVDAVIQ